MGEGDDDVNLTIQLNPISSIDDSESMRQTEDHENEDWHTNYDTSTSDTAYYPDLAQYFINVKVDPKRQNKFFITTKRLIRDMREYIKKYRGYLSHSVFRHVIQLILEERIEKIVVGQESMRSGELEIFYRKFYPKADDEEFIKQVIYDVYSGLYNEEESAESSNDPLYNSDLNSSLQELHLHSVTEDVTPEIEMEEEDEEELDITIQLKPISSKDYSESSSQTGYQENEDWYTSAEIATSPTAYHPDLSQYFINVKVDYKRQNKFFITTKRLKRDLREYIKKYRGYLNVSVFRHVIQLILEERIGKIVVGQEMMGAKELEIFYRKFYPKADDEEFIKQVIYDVYSGLYNEDESAEINKETEIVQKERNENEFSVQDETVSSEMDISEIDNDVEAETVDME